MSPDGCVAVCEALTEVEHLQQVALGDGHSVEEAARGRAKPTLKLDVGAAIARLIVKPPLRELELSQVSRKAVARVVAAAQRLPVPLEALTVEPMTEEMEEWLADALPDTAIE